MKNDSFASESRSAEFVKTVSAADVSTRSIDLPEATRDCAEDTLLAGPELLEGIDVIFAHNDDMALGTLEFLAERGIRPGTDVKIMSIDGTSDALDALQDGKINCVVECNPLLGPQLMKAITDLMQGKELPLRIITDENVFTKETPKALFSNRKY